MKLSIRFKSLFLKFHAYLLNIQSKAFVFTYFKWMTLQLPSEYCLWYYTFSHFDISLLYIFSCMNSMWKKRTMNGEERNRSCFLFYFFIFTVPKKRNSESSRSAFLCNLEAVLFGQSFCYQTYPFKTLFQIRQFLIPFVILLCI